MRVSFLFVNAQYPREFLFVFVTYTLSFYSIDYFIMPIQMFYLPKVSEHCCLLFIPHAIRVFAIWLYGGRGLLYLLISAHFSYYLVYDNHPTTYFDFLSPFVAPVITFACFELLKKVGFDPYHIRNWRILIFIGVASSIANGVILGIIYEFGADAIRNIIYYTIGDLNGLLFTLILLISYFKFERIFKKKDSIL